MDEISASADADDIMFSMQNSVWGGKSCLSSGPCLGLVLIVS